MTLKGTVVVNPDYIPEYIGPYLSEERAWRKQAREEQKKKDEQAAIEAANRPPVEKTPEEEAYEAEMARINSTLTPEQRLGRPIFQSALFTDEVRERIIDCIRQGGTINLSSMAARISKSTINRWVLLGKQEFDAGILDSPMSLLYQDIEYFSWEFIQDNLTIIKDAAEGGEWKAAAWILDRWKAVSAASQNERNAKSAQNAITTTAVGVAAELPTTEEGGTGMKGRIFATVVHQTRPNDPELDQIISDDEDLDED